MLTLECADGHQAYTKSRATTTLKAGATDEQIVQELQKTMPKVQTGAIEIPNQRKLPRGRVLNGNSRDILTRIARNNDANWSIQDGALVFLPKDKVLSDDAVLLSQDTGMINAPEQTDEGLELTCLLNPALQIGGLVQVESILEYFNGEYKIVKLAHSGDGIGGDWQSKLTVVGGKFQKVEKPKKSDKKDKKK